MGKILKHSFVDNIPFWILMCISIAIGVTGFFVPPKAENPPPVLKFISLLFAFAALWTAFVAMIRGIDARVTHGKTSLTIGDIDNNDRGAASFATDEPPTEEE